MPQVRCSRCKNDFDKTEVTFINDAAVCKSCSSGRGVFTSSPVKGGKAGQETGFSAKQNGLSREESFSRALLGAFTYPVRGGGTMVLIAGTIFFWFFRLVASLSIFGYIIGIFLGGYLSAYMMAIINSSAIGKPTLPEWPEFMDFWASIIRPLFLVTATVAVAFAPAAVYAFLLLPRGAPPAVLPALVILGLLYQPMGLLAVSVSGNLNVLNPLIIFPSIFRVPAEYLMACLTFLALVAIRKSSVFSMLIPVPIINSVLVNLLSLYFLMVQMRILGSIYFYCKEKMGWD